jgi:hypothetical protein
MHQGTGKLVGIAMNVQTSKVKASYAAAKGISPCQAGLTYPATQQRTSDLMVSAEAFWPRSSADRRARRPTAAVPAPPAAVPAWLMYWSRYSAMMCLRSGALGSGNSRASSIRSITAGSRSPEA